MDSRVERQKVAIITGASQGIGAGLATAFRREGYAVVATSRSISLSSEADLVTVRGGPASYEGVAALHPLGRVGEIADVAPGSDALSVAGFSSAATTWSPRRPIPLGRPVHLLD